MIFKILLVDLEKIIYSFSFYKETEEVLEYGIEFVLEEKEKPIDYLFAILQVTKDLPSEVKEQILYRSLISEFREEYFIESFNHRLISDQTIFIELDNIENNYLSDNTTYSLDSFYYYSD